MIQSFEYDSQQQITFWTGERMILRGSYDGEEDLGGSIKVWTDLHGSESNPLFEMTFPENGAHEIDMTDYFRAYPNNEWVRVKWEEYYADIDLSFNKGIMPENMVIPWGSLRQWYSTKGLPNATTWISSFLCPSRILERPSFGIQQRFETYGIPLKYNSDDDMDNRVSFYNGNGTYVSYSTLNNRLIYIPNSAAKMTFQQSYDGAVVGAIKIAPLVCGRKYCQVIWESCTGIYRVATFELVKSKHSTSDAYSLLNMNNEYVEIKGREDSFTIRLDQLSAYDLWYYSDILQSSNVKVRIESGETRRVEVTDKSITIPDGDAFNGVLEINVNFAKYDAVAM